MVLKFMSGGEGFTFVDAVVAILLSAITASAVFPLFTLFSWEWPEFQIRRRDVVALINLEADLRQELESVEVPYWSEGPEIAESGDSIIWSNDESRVFVVREERAVSITSSMLTRRYPFGDVPVLSLLNSQEGHPIGVRIAADDGTVADVLFHERPLESVEDAGSDDAGA